jgi:hypothetical protein
MNLVRASLPLLVAVSLGACAGAPPSDTVSPLQAADSKPNGSTSDPGTTLTCKQSADASGVPCKICVDATGAIVSDDCSGGGAGGTSGPSGAGGSGAGALKCLATTDPTTGATCETCYAADGSYTSTCPAPPSGVCLDASGKNTCGAGGSGGSAGSGGSGGSGATTVKCLPTTDPSTGAACKTCYAADGSITFNDCSGGTTLKCVPSSDPTTGAACQTCYAPDGSIASNTCSPAGSGGASCVAAPNIETGEVCKVCSDTTSGKLLFVDCPNVCPAPSSTTAPPPAK